ncbi:hypothetical protein BGZ60DRAFT_412262 [Tricladium varicosporioides]|nr:hypothetical protein BGZ60DRAFT_412262 [Hymenoscyphus varicosporioides]
MFIKIFEMMSRNQLLFSAVISSFLAITCAAVIGSDTGSAATAFGSYAITGTKTSSNIQPNARPFRRNILDLQNDTPAWSLYLQAMSAMQNSNENSQLSYFQIAGIHGQPYIPWNNVGTGPVSSWGGYCTHTSVLFPSWHRPYLALFEQVLGTYIQNIAQQYPPELRQRYQAAADNFRIPYWDWASDSQVPPAITQPQIQVTTPTGIQTITNPLYQYKFQGYFSQSALLNGLGQTVRNPDTVDGPSNYDKINALMSGEGATGKSWTALVKIKDYDTFATTALPGTSIEAVHGEIHTIIGGDNGHMTLLDWSAFDPIFWLHHCNVDRLFTMWQAINPSAFMTPLNEPGTFTLPRNSFDTQFTPLTPFTSNNFGTLYNSFTARSTKTFGYAYPEVQDWLFSPADLARNVTAQVNAMYDPTGIFRRDPKKALNPRSKLTVGSTTKEWSVQVQVSKFDLGGDYFYVRIFLGDVPANPQDWAMSNNIVGSLPIMPPPNIGAGPLPDIRVHNEFVVTHNLLGPDHDPEDVKKMVPYLKEKISWRIQKMDGTVVPTEKCPSLRVAVQDEVVTMAKSIYELPIYGKKTYHPEVTNDKIGGDKGGAAG